MFKKENTPNFGFVRALDLFGVPFNISHIGQLSTKTVFGGFFSFLLFSLFTVYFVRHAYQIIEHKTPSFLVEDVYATKERSFNLSASNFTFVIMLEDNKRQVNLSDPNENLQRIFKFDIAKVERHTNPQNKSDTQKIEEKIVMAQCTQSDNLGIMTPERFIIEGFGNNLCSRSSNLTIQGEYGGEVFTYIRLRLNPCDQSDPTKNCETDFNKVTEYLANGDVVMTLFFLDANLELSQYSNPLTFYLMVSEYWFINPMEISEHNLFFKDFTVQTQEGLMTHSFWNSTFFQFDYARSFGYYREPGSNEEFLTAYLLVSQNSKQAKRLYPTLLDGISSVGGLFTVFTGILAIPIVKYTKWVQRRSLAARLTYYNSKKGLKYVEMERKGSSSSSVGLELVPVSKEHQSQNEPDLETLRKIGSMNIRPSFFRFIRMLFCPFWKPRAEKEKFMEEMQRLSIETVSSKLDSVHLSKIIQEVHFLKSLLMTKEQITIFNSVSYPEIIGDENEDLFSHSARAKFSESELARSFKAVKESKDSMSLKLMERMSLFYRMAFKKMEETQNTGQPRPYDTV